MAIFSPKYKLHVHILQIVLIHVMMGLTVPRIFMKNQPRTRATTIALGMGAKSMIIIFYQILTTHVARLHRYRSLKAYAILNALEIVFWAAVVFLVLQANLQICVGVGCYLSWGVVGVAIVTTAVAAYMAIVSYLEFRDARRGIGRSGGRKLESSGESEERGIVGHRLARQSGSAGEGSRYPLSARGQATRG